MHAMLRSAVTHHVLQELRIRDKTPGCMESFVKLFMKELRSAIGAPAEMAGTILQIGVVPFSPQQAKPCAAQHKYAYYNSSMFIAIIIVGLL